MTLERELMRRGVRVLWASEYQHRRAGVLVCERCGEGAELLVVVGRCRHLLCWGCEEVVRLAYERVTGQKVVLEEERAGRKRRRRKGEARE